MCRKTNISQIIDNDKTLLISKRRLSRYFDSRYIGAGEGNLSCCRLNIALKALETQKSYELAIRIQKND